MNVSEQLLKILTDEGVKHIFGVAGDALNPLTAAMNEQDAIEWIKVKHEGNGSFAAFAQGEVGDNFGVCASTVGPGALHLVNGLYNAKKERTPVIAITGQVDTQFLGTNYHQEVDLTKVFEDICAYQAVIRTPEEAPRVIQRAIRIAINHRAVCRIELPADIAKMKAVNDHLITPVFRSKSALVPDALSLQKAVEKIAKADTIGILAGAGCRDSRDLVLDFAKKIKAPITHTVRSCDIFDHDAPNVVGLSGLIGNSAGYKAIMDPDLLIMLGTDFPYVDYLPKNKEVIQVDISIGSIGNRAAVTLGLHGDIKSVVSYLSTQVKEKQNGDFLKDLREKFLTWKQKNEEVSEPAKDFEYTHAPAVAHALSDIASDDAVFVVDTGTAAIWSTNFMNFNKDRRVIGAFNHGSMAVGIPAAIGASLLNRDREVWALTGDGSFHMAMQDFSTAVEYDLPIKIIVLNNSELGFVKIEMEEAGLAPNFDALKLENYDFAAFAELCGGKGLTIKESSDILPVMQEAKASTRPTIINAFVSPGEIALPPKIEPHHAANFGLSKAKEFVKSLTGDENQWENIKSEVLTYLDRELK